MKLTCPCCGYKTVEDDSDTHAICVLCGWENDLYQSLDPDQHEGANLTSLRVAQHRFIARAAQVSDFVKDRNWCPFAAPLDAAIVGRYKIRYFAEPRI